MKKMIYSSKRKRELLGKGKYLDYNYYILNLGTHPTAYVEIPKNHKYFKKHYNDINIAVHGGLTYSENYLWLEVNEEDFKIRGWFIGWDYAHLGDYIGYEENYPEEYRIGGKKWTSNEILKDVYSVCMQLKDSEKQC